MHEAALLRDLRSKVDELSRAHGSAPIVRARVALGALAHLDEPALREHWAGAMAGGPAAGAVLEVEMLPGVDHAQATAVVLRTVTFGDGGVRPRSRGRTATSSPREA